MGEKLRGGLWDEVLGLLAELGRSIESRLGDAGIAVLVVLAAWLLPFVAKILVVLWVANAYLARRGAPLAREQGGAGLSASLVVGGVLVLLGLAWLLADVLKVTVPWQVGLIALGLLLIAAGLHGRR